MGDPATWVLAGAAVTAAAVGTYSAVDSHQAAKASAKATDEANIATAETEGKATAREDFETELGTAKTAAEAKNPELAALTTKKRKGVKSTYTTVGEGAGMMEGTSLTPIGGSGS